MNKKFFIFFLFFGLSIIFFLFGKNANATVLSDITYDSNNVGTTTTSFGQSFKPNQNNFKAVKISTSEDLSASPADFYLCSGMLSQLNFSTTYNCSGELQSTIFNGTITPTCDFLGGLYRCLFTLPYSVSITPESQYFFSIKYGTNKTFWLVEIGEYANGQVGSGNNYISEGDAYFITYYDNSFIDWGIFWDIEVIIPSQNWLYTTMPNNIVYKYNNLGGVYQQARFQMYKLNAKNGTPTLSLPQIQENIASTTIKTIEGASINLVSGYYRLYNAHLWSTSTASTNFITTPIDFEIMGTSTNRLVNASTTLAEIMTNLEENICDGINTAETWGAILCAFKRAGLWLFKPDESSITSLINSYLEFKDVFPFNSFFGITDAFQNGVSTTTATIYQTFNIPFISSTGTIITLPVMSTSTLSNLIGENNNNIFRQSLIYFSWILAGMIIYFTIKRI